MKSIEPFIHRKIVVLHQDASIQQAARAMCDNNVGCVIVTDRHGSVIGLVTDRDLACFPLAFDIAPSEPLSGVMTGDPVWVEESASLEEVVGLMIENGVRRVPVLRENGKGARLCVGLVTLDELIARKAISPEKIPGILHSQLGKSIHPAAEHPGAWRGDLSDDRREARATQTAGKLYHAIADATGLSRAEAKRVAWIYLASLYRRLPGNLARNFACQLPSQISEDLNRLPPGPDESVSIGSVKEQIAAHLKRTDQDAEKIVKSLCSILSGHLGPHELLHVRSQLPPGARSLIHTATRAKARRRLTPVTNF